MKKIAGSIVLLLMVTLVNIANGQVQMGVKAGVNISSVDFENYASKSILRFNTGLVSQIDFNSTFFLRPELIYSVKGWDFGDGTMNLHYLNIPVLFGYKPIPKLAILAGPEVGFLLRTVRKPDSPNFDPPYEKLD